MRRPTGLAAKLECLAATGALALVLLFTFAGTAIAGTGIKSQVEGLTYGYWWQGASGGVDTTPPGAVPAGGLWVASDTGGPSAISAMRFTMAPGSADPVVTLSVANAAPSGQVSVVACPTSDQWLAPTGAGEWSARPISDCSKGQALGKLDSTGSKVIFDLASIAAGGGVNVVFLPAVLADPTSGSNPAQPPVQPYPVFSASFQQPTKEDVATSTAPANGSTNAIAAVPGLPLEASTGSVAPLEFRLGPTVVPSVLPSLSVMGGSTPASPLITSPSEATSAPRLTSVILHRVNPVPLLIGLAILVVFTWYERARRSNPPVLRLSIYDSSEEAAAIRARIDSAGLE